MNTRTSSKVVVFTQSFFLAGFEGIQPAGQYIVEIVEDLLEGVSFQFWRKRSIIIRLRPIPGVDLIALISPGKFDAALARDCLLPWARRGFRGERGRFFHKRLNIKQLSPSMLSKDDTIVAGYAT
jgi:hypothetical protein